MSLPNPKRPQSDLKHRVITCLNKLSDRDTLLIATAELESITRHLTHDTLSPFLTCLSTTDSAVKSPVRRQCARLLGLLSTTHGDTLSPHLSKMLSSLLIRLKDPDTSVRSACVDAITSMASKITKPPFSLFIKPLLDTILIAQDYNLQLGSALCLSAAINSSPDPQPAHLLKLLPKLIKLVKNDCFKPKPALLLLIATIITTADLLNRNLLSLLIPCLVEFLASQDWTARKAAAEALGKLAVTDKNLPNEFKSIILLSLENRRFDKVKVVRETINHSLELWKDDDALPMSQDSGDGETPQTKTTISTSRSPLSNNSHAPTIQKRSPLRSSHRKPSGAVSRKVDFKRPSDWKIEVAEPQISSLKVACENDNLKSENLLVPDSAESESCSNSKPKTKREFLNNTCDGKSHKFGGLRFGSRVVPFHENDNCELDGVEENVTEDVDGYLKEAENLSLIQKQLIQIENQQSSLFDLLQSFIGSSKSGITSLETRVNGIEKALSEISYDLAVSTGRISNTDPAANNCCILAGAEFLSPKFWKKTGGQFSTSRFSFSGRNQSLTGIGNIQDREANAKKIDTQRFQKQAGVGGTHRDSMGILESSLSNKTHDTELAQVCNAGGSFANFYTSTNLRARSSV